MKRNRLMIMSVETDFEAVHIDDHAVICEEKKKKDAWYSKVQVKLKPKSN